MQKLYVSKIKKKHTINFLFTNERLCPAFTKSDIKIVIITKIRRIIPQKPH